ncbi:methyltransferase domain-containing protein [Halenospora varia]|nr:methyltransferase domain-containing protein [Halenospora varia]
MAMLRCGRPAPFAIFGMAAVFLIVLFFQLSSNPTINEKLPDWVPTITDFRNGISDTLGTTNIKKMMEKSEKLWQKSVKARHEFRARHPDLDFFPAKDSPSYSSTPVSVWDLVPASYNCPWEVERIGALGDRGKWVCGMSRYEKNKKPCVMYSFGVQRESSFEEMLERTNCEIWGYDLSPEGFKLIKPEHIVRTHFLQAGVAGNNDTVSAPPTYTIQDLMQMNGHDYIDILKIDIEYAEFNALSALNAYTQEHPQDFPIGQMLIEMHLLKSQGITYPIFLDWWESMEYRGLRPSWTEPNLVAVSMGLEDGQARLAEYTMLNVLDRKNKLFF